MRTSGAILSQEAIDAIVHDGMLVPSGMPRFEELNPEDRAHIRQYLRTRADDLRGGRP